MVKVEVIYLQGVYKLVVVFFDVCVQVCLVWCEWQDVYVLVWCYQDELVLLCQCIVEENLLCYNGMFISVFVLLVDVCEQVVMVNVVIDVQCDFWIVDVSL